MNQQLERIQSDGMLQSDASIKSRTKGWLLLGGKENWSKASTLEPLLSKKQKVAPIVEAAAYLMRPSWKRGYSSLQPINLTVLTILSTPGQPRRS